MVEILWKRNRKVPVLVTPDLKGAMKVLTDTEKREKVMSTRGTSTSFLSMMVNLCII